jgi:outer membrane receptor protein involved in Fe transport
MAFNYRFSAPWKNGGMFNLKVNGNYLHRLEFIATPGADVDVDRDEAAIGAGGPFPRYSASGDLTWSKGPLTINYGINWFWKTRRYTTEQMAANPDRADPKYVWYKPYWEHQLFLSYDVEKRMNIYAGINNLWDEKPDVAITGYPVSAVGRFFYAGVKLRPF